MMTAKHRIWRDVPIFLVGFVTCALLDCLLLGDTSIIMGAKTSLVHGTLYDEVANSGGGGSVNESQAVALPSLLPSADVLAPICECLQRPEAVGDQRSLTSARAMHTTTWNRTMAKVHDKAGHSELAVIDVLLEAMRRDFRVYMHSVPAGRVTASQSSGGGNRGYQCEYGFKDALAHSEMRTTDADKASAYYVPTAMVASRGVAKEKKQSWPWMDFERANLVDGVKRAAPDVVTEHADSHFYVHGRDKNFAKPGFLKHGIGIQLHSTPFLEERWDKFWNADKLKQWFASGVRVTFDPAVDISVAPGCNGGSFFERAWQIGSKPLAERKRFALFAGGFDNYEESSLVRNLLAKIKNLRATPNQPRPGEPPAVAVRIGGRYKGGTDYGTALSDTVFCLCPRGHGIWSPRLVDSLMYGCIPVIIADGYWMPSSCVVDWRRFAVFVPEDQAHRVVDILEGYRGVAAAMQKEVLHVRGRFAANSKRRGDSFEIVMLELYLRTSVCHEGRPAL